MRQDISLLGRRSHTTFMGKSCGGACCLHPQILPIQHFLDSYTAAHAS